MPVQDIATLKSWFTTRSKPSQSQWADLFDTMAHIESVAESGGSVGMALRRKPSLISGTPVAVPGPPASGTYVLGEVFIDGLNAMWQCNSAGTPGTWHQVEPAVVSAFYPGAKPTGYQILRKDLRYARYWWDGTYWQTDCTLELLKDSDIKLVPEKGIMVYDEATSKYRQLGCWSGQPAFGAPEDLDPQYAG